MSTCPIIAIDPGNTQSGYCVIDRSTLRPLEFGKIDNAELLQKLSSAGVQGWRWAVIEMVASYGMSVGRDVFDTTVWIGRFYQVLSDQCPVRMLCRIEEKKHICHDSRANDTAIRRALIDRFAAHDLKNGKGTKKKPDFFYGFKADVWAAYALGLTAIEISNSTDKVNAPERTKMYQTIVSKYSAKEREGMAEMLAEVIMGMEQNPDQDFLGSLYMMCELGNDHAGQFFTPYDVCRCMAEITFDPKLHPDMEGFISVSDPACGAGATLLAFLNVCKRRNICYHNKVLVIAQDIDFIVGLMCYIQCSFMGCAGYVVIGDTLVNPATAYDSRGLLPAGPQNRIWYMPLFSTDVWYMRRQIAQMNLLFEPKGEPAKIEKSDIKPANLQKSIKNEPKAPENEPLNETKTGQLTFF